MNETNGAKEIEGLEQDENEILELVNHISSICERVASVARPAAWHADDMSRSRIDAMVVTAMHHVSDMAEELGGYANRWYNRRRDRRASV